MVHPHPFKRTPQWLMENKTESMRRRKEKEKTEGERGGEERKNKKSKAARNEHKIRKLATKKLKK